MPAPGSPSQLQKTIQHLLSEAVKLATPCRGGWQGRLATPVARFVKSVLSDINAGMWWRVLQRKPPTVWLGAGSSKGFLVWCFP